MHWKKDGYTKIPVNRLTHREDYFVHSVQEKVIKCLFGQRLEILLIMQHKFVD